MVTAIRISSQDPQCYEFPAILDRSFTFSQAMSRRSLLHVAVETGNYDEVMRLLATDSGKHMLNANGLLWRTPLHLACIHGHLDVVRPLIDHGSDAYAVDKDFDTPFTLAVSYKNFDIASVLVKEYHCDPNARDKDNTPLLHSVYSKWDFDTLKFLVDHGERHTFNTSSQKE